MKLNHNFIGVLKQLLIKLKKNRSGFKKKTNITNI